MALVLFITNAYYGPASGSIRSCCRCAMQIQLCVWAKCYTNYPGLDHWKALRVGNATVPACAPV